MKKAYVFPGQGAQFVGMGKDMYENSELAKELFEKANEVLGFRITDLMFDGTDEDLRQTKVTQPAVFLHSVILTKTNADKLVGMIGVITKDVKDGERGSVKVEYQEWTAIAKNNQTFSEGTKVVISEIIGNKLVVERIEEIEIK